MGITKENVATIIGEVELVELTANSSSYARLHVKLWGTDQGYTIFPVRGLNWEWDFLEADDSFFNDFQRLIEEKHLPVEWYDEFLGKCVELGRDAIETAEGRKDLLTELESAESVLQPGALPSGCCAELRRTVSGKYIATTKHDGNLRIVTELTPVQASTIINKVQGNCLGAADCAQIMLQDITIIARGMPDQVL